MDVVAGIEPYPQPAELMDPTDRSLDHPTIDTQATAVGRPPLGQLRVDPPLAQLLPLAFVIEAPVAQGAIRTAPGSARPAGDWGGWHPPAARSSWRRARSPGPARRPRGCLGRR